MGTGWFLKEPPVPQERPPCKRNSLTKKTKNKPPPPRQNGTVKRNLAGSDIICVREEEEAPKHPPHPPQHPPRTSHWSKGGCNRAEADQKWVGVIMRTPRSRRREYCSKNKPNNHTTRITRKELPRAPTERNDHSSDQPWMRSEKTRGCQEKNKNKGTSRQPM